MYTNDIQIHNIVNFLCMLLDMNHPAIASVLLHTNKFCHPAWNRKKNYTTEQQTENKNIQMHFPNLKKWFLFFPVHKQTQDFMMYKMKTSFQRLMLLKFIMLFYRLLSMQTWGSKP